MRGERRTRKMASRGLAACAGSLARAGRGGARPGSDPGLTLQLKDKTEESDRLRDGETPPLTCP